MKLYVENNFNKSGHVPMIVADLAHINFETVVVTEE